MRGTALKFWRKRKCNHDETVTAADDDAWLMMMTDLPNQLEKQNHEDRHGEDSPDALRPLQELLFSACRQILQQFRSKAEIRACGQDGEVESEFRSLMDVKVVAKDTSEHMMSSDSHIFNPFPSSIDRNLLKIS